MAPTISKTENQLISAIALCKKHTGKETPSDDLICAVFHSLTMEEWDGVDENPTSASISVSETH